MHAWQVVQYGEPIDALRWNEAPAPEPGPGQVSIAVRAAAANFPDALLCRGTYQVRPELPFVPGVEACGTVLAVGPGVDRLAVGQRVMGGAALPHGTFAECALLGADSTFAAPDALDDAQAAAFTIAYQTGWVALHRRVAIQAGQTLLVHAAAGGVGSAAVQLGKAAGARVIGVAAGPAKAQVVRDLGADVVVDRLADDFVTVVKDLTGGAGVDLVFDPVGGDAFERSTKCIAFEGSIIVVGFAGGTIQSAALNHALVKNYSIVGLHWGLYLSKDPMVVQQAHAALMTLVADGAIRPLIGDRLPMSQVPRGVQSVADGLTVGRVVFDA